VKTWEDKIDISKDQWRELLSSEEIIKKEDFNLLKKIYFSKNHMVTGIQLAKLMDMSHHGPLNLQVGRMSKRIIKRLNVETSKRSDGRDRWWHVPFLGMKDDEGFHWILRPELKAAMDNILGNESFNSPEELEFNISEAYFEGAKKQIYVNAYERNLTARNKCISYYGWKCVICGFDFIATYGKIGENTIHVHHKKPLSEISDQYIVDPVRDLVPVCPNCHVIIHKRTPPYTVEEVKHMIERNKK